MQAIIEFDPKGIVLTANQNFLDTFGYELEQIVGKHHRQFVEESYANTAAYQNFWRDLARGEASSGEFKRFNSAGEIVWIQASYTPVLDAKGNVAKVVKLASDITNEKNRAVNDAGQIAAINRSLAAIEFDLDGTILKANGNFLDAMGYQEAEIIGKHHRIFVDPDEAASSEYAAFWSDLRNGQFKSDQYLRIGKGGKRVWIQASYNPIFDEHGTPVKVIKFATVITARKDAMEAIGQSLDALASGDLTCQIEKEFNNDLDPVRVALNKSIGTFVDIVSRIKLSTSGIRAATQEILAGANDLSDRTNREASAIAQTTSSVEMLASTVEANKKSASHASEATDTLSVGAANADEAMGRATGAMTAIAESSSKISNIISLIDDIAFQTNLLALNASVEAARAGEAGKGFAVVAVEVRRLAQSSANSSTEIKQLIEQASKEVGGGEQFVKDATEKVRAMLTDISQSNDVVRQISSATSEQANTINEVSLAIREIDEMSQRNAALVEEMNAAIEQCERQSSDLDMMVEQFKLDERGSGAAHTHRSVA
ncbi:methyl-accepting chemotaxis protein [Maritalea sp. S77]|uniref:methyl-accepting chemotaxis protein n=1 Tax=Maritalea sp. S77 TaxID=3415125 RepID=UPI003C7E4580